MLALVLAWQLLGPGAPPTELTSVRTPLLGDHLSVALPEGMGVEKRRVDIMSAPESDEDETRAVLDVGKVRFVLMANEAYATAPKDLIAALRPALQRHYPEGKLQPLRLARPLSGVGLSLDTRGEEDANLVFLAFVVNTDRTVESLRFFVNPAGAENATAWLALAQKITASLAPGKRVLDSRGGERTLEDLVITLPAGWVEHTQQGPDFVVYHLTHLLPLGPAHEGCGIYRGGFPSYQYAQDGLDAGKVKKVPGKLLGANVDWVVWSAGGSTTTEAIARHGNERVHVFCTAKDEAGIAALRKIAETLRGK